VIPFSADILFDTADRIHAAVSAALPGTEAGNTAMHTEGQNDQSTAPGPAPALQPDVLTSAEANELEFGAIMGLRKASDLLKDEPLDLKIAMTRLWGIPDTLRAISKPAALVPKLHHEALTIDGQLARLQAVLDGPAGALADAQRHWDHATMVLMTLTASKP